MDVGEAVVGRPCGCGRPRALGVGAIDAARIALLGLLP